MKAGIIGCGSIVENGHIQAFQKHSDLATVTALADTSAERLKFAAEKLKVPADSCYSDYREMLEKEELDLVDMALPHTLHKDVLINCANAKKHIISEKPLAVNLDEVDEILIAVKKNNVQLAVLHNYFFLPAFEKAMKIVKSGVLGDIFLIRSELFQKSHFHSADEYDPDWRSKASLGGGGSLIDNGYHQVYYTAEMMGSPVKSVYAAVNTYYHDIDVDDTALLLMTHDNGGTTSLQVGWGLRSDGAYVHEYHGKKGSLYMSWGEKPISVFYNDTEKWEYPECDYNMYDSFIVSFEKMIGKSLMAIKNNTRPPVSGSEARRNLEIITAAYESSKEQRNITV